MTLTIHKSGEKLRLLLLVAAFSIPAFGSPVDFTTTGVFACGAVVGCSTSNNASTVTITNNGNTLHMTAEGLTNLSIPAGDSNPDINGSPLDDVNVITFNTTSTNQGPPAGGVNTAGLMFTLNIDQTSPPTAPGSLGGSFTGSIDARGSDTVVDFAPNQTSIILGGNYIYTLDFIPEAPNFWTIPNPGLNKTGITTETATVTPNPGTTHTTVTPEPTFMTLTGFGFAGLAFVAYRRRQKGLV